MLERLQACFDNIRPIYLTLLILASPIWLGSLLLEILPIQSLVNQITGDRGLGSFLLGELMEIVPLIMIHLLTHSFVNGATILLLDRYQTQGTLDLRTTVQTTLAKLVDLVVSSLLSVVAIGIGLLFCLVPGVFLSIQLIFTHETIMLDEQSGIDSLGASWNLIRDRTWELFLELFPIWGITILIAFSEKLLPDWVVSGLYFLFEPLAIAYGLSIYRDLSGRN
ncbi:MAG: hypothetical protein VKJ24_21310 [Synechococcales bacterium]|nr:hypothetical protein [Synechococcales bacterium]